MDVLMMIFTALGTIASIISAIIAVRAKDKIIEIQKNKNEVKIETESNSGQIIGINSGYVK